MKWAVIIGTMGALSVSATSVEPVSVGTPYIVTDTTQFMPVLDLLDIRVPVVAAEKAASVTDMSDSVMRAAVSPRRWAAEAPDSSDLRIRALDLNSQMPNASIPMFGGADAASSASTLLSSSVTTW